VDQLFVLMREMLNALPNPRATLKPTRIAVSILIIARFPASLTVSGYAAAVLLMPVRRFPPPWSVEELDACFVVRDHSG
jgi:hypothetical protein